MRAESEIFKREAVQTQSDRADEFAESYEAMLDDPFEDCFKYSRYRLQQYLDHMIPAEGTGLRLLDVGCGTGHHIAKLSRQGYETAGVDISPEMLRHASAINPSAVILEADVEDIPLPDAEFDLIISIEVLRHLPRSFKCISEMYRLLKPGGKCLVTATPLLNSNGYTLINFLANKVRIGTLARHRQAFHSSGRLRREFSRAGFDKIEIIGVYLGPVNWIGRLAPSLLPGFLRNWETVDKAAANRALFREFTNMFLVQATKPGTSESSAEIAE